MVKEKHKNDYYFVSVNGYSEKHGRNVFVGFFRGKNKIEIKNRLDIFNKKYSTNYKLFGVLFKINKQCRIDFK